MLEAKSDCLVDKVDEVTVASTFNIVLEGSKFEDATSDLQFAIWVKVLQHFAYKLEDIKLFLFLLAILVFSHVLFETSLIH